MAAHPTSTIADEFVVADPRLRIYRRWVVSVTAGECLGFGIPALVGAVSGGASPSIAVAALVAGGSLEGAILGWSQARVLRRALPGLSTRRWIGLTAGGAALAWLIGMLPSTLHDSWATWSAPTTILVAATLGTVLLCSIGAAQRIELRRHLRHANCWVWTTAAAWCAGLTVFSAVAMPLWHEGQTLPTIIAIGVLGGLAMATTVASVTGWAIGRLLAGD
jgi:hypothetical protein